jgi:hypothetical protein
MTNLAPNVQLLAVFPLYDFAINDFAISVRSLRSFASKSVWFMAHPPSAALERAPRNPALIAVSRLWPQNQKGDW